MRGQGKINKTIRVVRRIFRPVAVILIYHRITDLRSDPFRISVSPEKFAKHLAYLREKYVLISLNDLVDGIKCRVLPYRSVVITFDDGYADNFYKALPILESAQVPATVFVTTNPIQNLREFWWDDLERILLEPDSLPSLLRVSIQNEEINMRVAGREKRQDLFNAIYNLVRLLPANEREQVLFELAKWAGLPKDGRPDHFPMKCEELRQLASNNLIDIGAHTMTHPVLSSMKPDDQYAEVFGSRQALESILGSTIQTFSYPFGNPEDYSRETVDIVKSLGFQAAVTTIHGGVEANSDLFQLNRCEVNNWDLPEFRKRVDSFFLA